MIAARTIVLGCAVACGRPGAMPERPSDPPADAAPADVDASYAEVHHDAIDPARVGSTSPVATDREWLRQARRTLRTVDVARCANDAACLCAALCESRFLAPPAGHSELAWSDVVRLEITATGAVARCETRPAPTATWDSRPCPQVRP